MVRGVPIQVSEDTEYPFRNTVQMTLRPSSPISFPVLLRIPGWAKGTIIEVNGKAQPTPAPNTFARVTRTWQAGDVINIKFPFEPRASRWFNQSIAFERGPLVFSLPIGETWVKLTDRGLTADWQVFPNSQWNYAVALDPDNGASRLVVSQAPISERPFSAKPASLSLRVKGRKLPGWRPEDGAANPVPPSPVSSDQPEETIALIPYAAAKLRITAFPLITHSSSPASLTAKEQISAAPNKGGDVAGAGPEGVCFQTPVSKDCVRWQAYRGTTRQSFARSGYRKSTRK
jgi:hypothetical protein